MHPGATHGLHTVWYLFDLFVAWTEVDGVVLMRTGGAGGGEPGLVTGPMLNFRGFYTTCNYVLRKNLHEKIFICREGKAVCVGVKKSV